MFGFYIKKAFFDGWDNLITLVLHNFVYILILLLELGVMMVTGENLALFFVFSAVVILILSVSMGGTAAVVYNWSNYKGDTWHSYAKGIMRNIRHSLFFFLVILFLLLVSLLVVPFYLSMENTLGLILGVVMVWLSIFIMIALPFYFPLMNLLPGDGPWKTFKKCFLIAGDNLGYTFLLLLHNTVDLVLSVVTMGMVPGVTGLMLGSQDMMKLLMKKYDWMEENPGKGKKDMDWSELIYEEKETLGPRSLKNMIFPWK